MKLDANEIAELKGQGFLAQKGNTHFACRVVPRSGYFTAEDMQHLAEIAEKFGEGRLNLTQRCTIEISGIAAEYIEDMKKVLDQHGFSYGGTGSRVRAVVCCKGSYCRHGMIDTQALSARIYDRYYTKKMPLPHKFKINIAGCPNNCTKVELNDLGIKPWRGQLRLFAGGRCGREIQIAKPLETLIDPDDLEEAIDRILAFFQKHGREKERFGQMLKRLQEEEPEFSLETIIGKGTTQIK